MESFPHQFPTMGLKSLTVSSVNDYRLGAVKLQEPMFCSACVASYTKRNNCCEEIIRAIWVIMQADQEDRLLPV